ncbi:serine hydroxymethyltransferase 2 (mitochondrial) [Cryptosporidium bovis]|uniref:serine hydroxymethyltransferase 2 (mitochondrial) n=1 Tax=Cryptosporidium bovis TaxID=310047 RepID=UPI00351A613E|nr:serine hydroxymethyltransferase 2 (mitochondrial) [Cryptosporidium bovis]
MADLVENDNELLYIIKRENEYHNTHLNLHPNENVMMNSAREVLGSVLTNKYSEGYPGARYYTGTGIVDKIETLCTERLKKFFHLEKSRYEWLFNVQCYSSTYARFAICMGSVEKMGRIITFYCNENEKSALEKYYQVEYFNMDDNYDGFNIQELRLKCEILKPKLLVISSMSMPKIIDFKSIYEICEEFGIIFAIDISEIAILISANRYGDENSNPFEYGDIIFSDTQSSIGGPKGGFIIVNNTKNPGLFQKINMAVFPGIQGGPHNNQIGSLAVQLHGLMNSQISHFVQEAVNNSKVLAKTLLNNGVPLICNGTDTHLVSINCSKELFPYELISEVLMKCGIRHSVNSCGKDRASITFGTLIYTFRGGDNLKMEKIGNLISKCVKLGVELSKELGEKQKDQKTTYSLFECKINECKRFELISEELSEILGSLRKLKN